MINASGIIYNTLEELAYEFPINENKKILMLKLIFRLKNSAIFFFLFISFIVSGTEKDWKASWIISPLAKNESNSWVCFRKVVNISKVPSEVIASIAVDSKYWLWINEKLVVFEGELKRGPSPGNTYYDEVNLSPFLRKGDNVIAVLVCYFGKEGFSHQSSGQSGLLFDCQTKKMSILSDDSWQTFPQSAFVPFEGSQPNFRLPESCLHFDARKDIGNWQSLDYNTTEWFPAIEVGDPPCEPWNALVLRPIPQWKDSGLKDYDNIVDLPEISTGEPVVCKLPANLQITPWLKVEAKDGNVIDIRTDHYIGGSEPSIQARYTTKNGIQEYESFGWMNGEEVIYTIPVGVKILGLKYRETGYNTGFSGSFHCSDDFFNCLWKKARRTLYVNMRDTYMDCPDRERAQWWGDEVIEGGEAFYAFDCQSHLLFRKGMYELIKWQKPDSIIFAPIPAGNWDKELPDQMLASIGYYGFWNYYLQSGDLKTIEDLYDGVMRYISLWKIKENGSLVFRKGEWPWGAEGAWADWGENKDIKLLQNTWYYLALKGVIGMASAIGRTDDVIFLDKKMTNLKIAFNRDFWNGEAYRYPEYKGLTDDRVQALAVISGLADESKYPQLFEVFSKNEHASPYMEKFVIEAYFRMGKDQAGLERLKRRFGSMVMDPDNSTLWEVWGNSTDGFSGGTTNHGWSGGGLTILSQYVCGISPIEPGYTRFQVAPQPGSLSFASAVVESVKGIIKIKFNNQPDMFDLFVTVPEQTLAEVQLPKKRKYTKIYHDGKLIWENGVMLKEKRKHALVFSLIHGRVIVIPGKWRFNSR